MEDQGLLATRVPRTLEMKSKLFGFEMLDLLLIFMNLALTNLIFGATSFRYLMVWGTTIGMALFLYIAKRGKPDNYLQHLGEFTWQPAYKSAAGHDRIFRKFRKDAA